MYSFSKNIFSKCQKYVTVIICGGKMQKKKTKIFRMRILVYKNLEKGNMGKYIRKGLTCRYGVTTTVIICEKFRVKWDFFELSSSKTHWSMRFWKWNLKEGGFWENGFLNFGDFFFAIWNCILQQIFVLKQRAFVQKQNMPWIAVNAI